MRCLEIAFVGRRCDDRAGVGDGQRHGEGREQHAAHRTVAAPAFHEPDQRRGGDDAQPPVGKHVHCRAGGDRAGEVHRQFAELPQPSISEIETDVELYPEERRYRVAGRGILAVKGFTDNEFGPALIFEHHPKAVRLDPELNQRLKEEARSRNVSANLLINAAVDAGKPFLGICRGMQLLNVAFGGTLIQHLGDDTIHSVSDVNDVMIEHSVALRPGTKHKLRFEYTPIEYLQADGQLTADIVFNGITYPVTLPVSTDFQWKAYRFAYEWDFIYRDRGFLGLILEAKYTDVETTLSNFIDTEFVRARAPIPAIGCSSGVPSGRATGLPLASII